MALAKIQKTIFKVNSNTLPASGHTYSIQNSGGGSAIAIYSNSSGTAPLDNPGTLPDNGLLSFFIRSGDCRIKVTDPDTLEEQIWDNVPCISPDILSSASATLQFATISDLINCNPINKGETIDPADYVGQKVSTVVNNTTSNSGGAEYIIKTEAQRIADGDVIDGYANHYLLGGSAYAAILQTDTVITADKFGLIKNDTSVNSSPVLNAFFAYCKKQQYSYAPASDVGYVFMRATLTAEIPTGVYAVAETVNATNEDGNINFNDSVFVPHASYNPANWAFDFVAWTTEISRMRTAKFTSSSSVVKIRNNNADSGIVVLDRCNFGGSGNYEIDCRSSIVTFNKCRIDRITKMVVTSCDKLRFDTCWINPPEFSADESCLFEVLDHSPIIEFDGGVFVPRPQTFARCALVNMSNAANLNAKGAIIKFINILAGNESNTTSYVNVYSPSNAATTRGSRVYFLGGSYGSSSGGAVPVVRLFALPNSVTFSNVDGYEEDTHNQSLVYFDATHQTYSAAQAYLTANSRPSFKIYLNGNVQQNFAGFPRGSNMLLALKSEPQTTYGTVTVDGGIAVAIAYPTNASTNRYIAFRMTIINKNNGGADLISEYVIAGDFSGTMTVAPVFEGSSVAAPRLTTTGTTVSIDTNGSVLSQTYAYQIQQIGDWQNPFI